MKKEILEMLGKEHFVSGEKLAEKIGVSRTAVWKQIKSLKEIGYKIESVKNKGYRLVSRPDIPIPEEIKSDLKTNIVGKKIIYFKKIDSTNLYCKDLVKKNVEEGTVVVADIQERGKGRKDRVWSSPEGGIYFSFILYPCVPPQYAMAITMAASVSVVEAIEKITGLKPVIKWPNDILINGKKVCGILTELDAEMDKINYAIVGIGINVNSYLSSDLRDIASSLQKETDQYVSRVNLLKNIIIFFDKNYAYVKSFNYDKIRDLWFSYADIIGKKVRVAREKDIVLGIVSDVDESGCLILKTKKGFEKIVSGDISFL